MFYFEIDNSFDFYYTHSGVWPSCLNTNAKKLSLKKFEKVLLKKGWGAFIRHGIDDHIKIIAYLLGEELHKGKSISEIDLSKAYLDSLNHQATAIAAPFQQLAPTMPPSQDTIIKKPKTSKKGLDDEFAMNDFSTEEEDLIDRMNAASSQAPDKNLFDLGENLGLDTVGYDGQQNQPLCSKCLEFTNEYKMEKVYTLYC